MGPKRKAAKKAEQDWSKMTVAQLKKECKNRALDDGGRKAELVARIEVDESGDAGMSIRYVICQSHRPHLTTLVDYDYATTTTTTTTTLLFGPTPLSLCWHSCSHHSHHPHLATLWPMLIGQLWPTLIGRL